MSADPIGVGGGLNGFGYGLGNPANGADPTGTMMNCSSSPIYGNRTTYTGGNAYSVVDYKEDPILLGHAIDCHDFDDGGAEIIFGRDPFRGVPRTPPPAVVPPTVPLPCTENCTPAPPPDDERHDDGKGDDSEDDTTISELKKTVCGWLPSGRTMGVSAGAGNIGGAVGGLEVVLNYDSGQISGFA